MGCVDSCSLSSQVEGVVGTYFANRHAVDSTTGSTVISFDKGGRWNLLTAPGVDRNGRPIVCVPVSSPFTPHRHTRTSPPTRSGHVLLYTIAYAYCVIKCFSSLRTCTYSLTAPSTYTWTLMLMAGTTKPFCPRTLPLALSWHRVRKRESAKLHVA